MKKFRELKAEELEVRAASISEKGVQLLIYKTARVDMDVLDEAVGAENWQDEFYENKGILFCRIGIKFDGEWIWKGDAGSESNTEAEKGNASDARKRAGFVWGIGRELYSAPFIWVNSNNCTIEKNNKGKLVCRDKFFVDSIEYAGGKITKLVIATKNGTVFNFGSTVKQPSAPKKKELSPLQSQINELCGIIAKQTNTTAGKVYKQALTQIGLQHPVEEGNLPLVVSALQGIMNDLMINDDDIPDIVG